MSTDLQTWLCCVGAKIQNHSAFSWLPQTQGLSFQHPFALTSFLASQVRDSSGGSLGCGLAGGLDRSDSGDRRPQKGSHHSLVLAVLQTQVPSNPGSLCGDV